jgi:hypothetical protein
VRDGPLALLQPPHLGRCFATKCVMAPLLWMLCRWPLADALSLYCWLLLLGQILCHRYLDSTWWMLCHHNFTSFVGTLCVVIFFLAKPIWLGLWWRVLPTAAFLFFSVVTFDSEPLPLWFCFCTMGSPVAASCMPFFRPLFALNEKHVNRCDREKKCTSVFTFQCID